MIPVSQRDRPAASERFLVGSYTEPYGPFRAVGDGLTLVSLDLADGRLETIACLPLPNPAYLRPIGAERVAVVLETDDARAGIALVRIDAGALLAEDRVPSPGRVPCHLDLHPSGRWLAGTCYGTGEVFALPLGAGGRLAGDKLVWHRRTGRSVHPVRQTSPHPHAVRFSNDGSWMVVADLGTDEVVSYRFDVAHGPDFSWSRSWHAPKGSGPRLPLFSTDGHFLVLVEEIAAQIVSFAWQDGALVERSRVSTLPIPIERENTAAGLRWHPSGTVIGVSNRGAQSISLFHFDPGSGELEPWLSLGSGGTKPRDFCFSRCGRWLVATNQDSDILATFEIDVEAGRIADTGARLRVRSPSCIRPVG